MILDEWHGPLKKAVYVFPMFYNLSASAAKSAALLLYIRMASAHPFLRNASYAVLAIVALSGIILFFMNVFVSVLHRGFAVAIATDRMCPPSVLVVVRVLA